MAKFKNYKQKTYRFSHNKRKDYTYKELLPYFFIDGSEVVYCKKDFGMCNAHTYYLIYDGEWYGCGFVIRDWDNGFKNWIDKEYMKK